MLYGFAVWGHVVLSTTGSLHVHCTDKFGTSHRCVLCVILGMSNELRNEWVYILAGNQPLQLHIANQVYHFAKSMKDNPCTVGEPLAWL